jgi:hypothetical protein
LNEELEDEKTRSFPDSFTNSSRHKHFPRTDNEDDEGCEEDQNSGGSRDEAPMASQFADGRMAASASSWGASPKTIPATFRPYGIYSSRRRSDVINSLVGTTPPVAQGSAAISHPMELADDAQINVAAEVRIGHLQIALVLVNGYSKV